MATVTLHVGLGTFQPLHEEVVEAVKLHSEHYRISAENAATIQAAQRVCGGRHHQRAHAGDGGAHGRAGRRDGRSSSTRVCAFRTTGAMLTNFHLPRTSLLLLVCAFGGKELILDAYRHAVEAGYRFYSYGDCMLIL